MPEATDSNLGSIAELKSNVAGHGRAIESFDITGVVCALATGENAVVVQDASATALLEVPTGAGNLRVGETLRITGQHCTVTLGRGAIQLGTAPVVDNDGAHSALLKSGDVFLNPGLNSIRLAWFNRRSPPTLDVEYEGPDTPRQKVPSGALYRRKNAEGKQAPLQPGLHYLAYTGTGWYSLPDFATLDPAAQGIATNFCAAYAGGNSALVFDGLLRISRAGVYTFYVQSADGSRLDVGDAGQFCTVTPTGRRAVPEVASLDEALANPGTSRWIKLEGTVNFAARRDGGLELEIATRTDTVQAQVLSGQAGALTNLLHRKIRAFGICEVSRDLGRNKAARLLIPGPVEILPSADGAGDSPDGAPLTAANQVQRLKPAQAAQKIAVKLKGVVTQASPTSLVLQDFTGGVFIHYTPTNWVTQPRIGDLWEIEGVTDPGDFSPVVYATNGTFLSVSTLPEPVHPTWDQLLNGSLDAQYAELQGVVTAVSDNRVVLLTRGGKLNVLLDELRRSYADGRDLFVETHAGAVPMDSLHRSYLGCGVRIRGVLVAVWNPTGQVQAGEIRVVAATVNVDEPRPADPFVLETRGISELLRFDPRANALQRTKVAGQIVHARPREFYIEDNQTGLRAVTEEAVSLQPGDLVEAVGFPQLGGASPVLIEAQIRKTGHAPLPAPIPVNSANLLDRKLDSTLVELEAMLLSDTMNRDERVLELQAGPHHFLARLNSAHSLLGSLATGCRLRLTGVYTSVRDDRGNASLDPFELRLNRAADVVVLEKPSWWTVEHALTVAATLAAGLGLALVWVTLLRKKVEERTVQLQREIEERQSAERHRAIDRERTRVAQDLHDELGAGLTEVSILGSLAKTQTIPVEARERYVDQLTNVARSLVTALDEIVWAVNPQYDSVASLATYYSLFAQRFLNVAGIACRLQVSDRIPEQALDSKMRHGIFRAFKEALNNVVRHSGATEVRLGIEVSDGALKLSLADNGRGFDVNRTEPGADGLKGMRERMRDLGGSCDITSEPGRGTSVELRLPLKTF